MKTDYDRTRFKLGDLCPFDHAWNGTKSSLRRTTSGRCVQCENEASYARRHLQSKSGRAGVAARFKLFGNRCAYCGSGHHLQADHFFPLWVVGGNDMGNIVPACRSCNSSKCNKHPERWFRTQPFFTERRFKRILRLLNLKDTTTIQRCLL